MVNWRRILIWLAIGTMIAGFGWMGGVSIPIFGMCMLLLLGQLLVLLFAPLAVPNHERWSLVGLVCGLMTLAATGGPAIPLGNAPGGGVVLCYFPLTVISLYLTLKLSPATDSPVPPNLTERRLISGGACVFLAAITWLSVGSSRVFIHDYVQRPDPANMHRDVALKAR